MTEFSNEIQTAAIIPAFNEGERVGNVIHAALLSTLVDAVIVVDDGSTDNTHAVAGEAIIVDPLLSYKQTALVRHPENKGKTEALLLGVETAKAIGGTSLCTLVFLDADSSPIWSRDTPNNMKLWQRAIHGIPGTLQESLHPGVIEGRTNAFITLLARYIDEIIQPVSDGQEIMRAGMYNRNTVIDTLLSAVGWVGHAGNRAIPIEVWDSLQDALKQQDAHLERWEIEGAINGHVYSLGGKQGNFMMHGVVNVGSRVKAGGLIQGVKRMGQVHGQALRGSLKAHALGSGKEKG